MLNENTSPEKNNVTPLDILDFLAELQNLDNFLAAANPDYLDVESLQNLSEDRSRMIGNLSTMVRIYIEDGQRPCKATLRTA